jgi:hypothetical protein
VELGVQVFENKGVVCELAKTIGMLIDEVELEVEDMSIPSME